jgi:hypothetical protein
MIRPSTARRLWQQLERVHALVYFAPEASTEYAVAGLKGYWMGYFASRTAAMGPVPAEVVIATVYNFHPDRVRRAIPDAWRFSTPERVLAARLGVADAALRRATDVDAPTIAEAADLAEQVARTCSPEGRPLFAAHMSLPWPPQAHMRLWHAATLIREHRGDGHIAVLVAEQIDGFESHLLAAAAGVVDPAQQRSARGISEEEWAAAAARLRRRGLLGDDDSFTDAGREVKARIEARTDVLAGVPIAAVGEDGCARLLDLVGSAFAGDETVPFPNPMGLTRAPGR